ncbi:hypothetical protein [Neptuniibacter caesariensis]|uniref:Uncharacterized protein n=1 Tax=Neptuniibacter caesariensis TaxID=207954 RepID=A0A7U8C7E0_NEPCE|nr:hypothetical protein [Neptuniibacter caesariensis]EAR62041.1 hypothetical protein MED92_10059 [Oceanospirillum sp. MED92] [Neptuniibacter caesariensis]
MKTLMSRQVIAGKTEQTECSTSTKSTAALAEKHRFTFFRNTLWGFLHRLNNTATSTIELSSMVISCAICLHVAGGAL